MWPTRSTPEEDTHVGQPCGESSASRELVLFQQPPSETIQRTLAPSYPRTTAPTSAMGTQAGAMGTQAGALGTQTSHESPLNNNTTNRGKRNKVSQRGRGNLSLNEGDENQVDQDSNNYEQRNILLSSCFLPVCLAIVAVIMYLIWRSTSSLSLWIECTAMARLQGDALSCNYFLVTRLCPAKCHKTHRHLGWRVRVPLIRALKDHRSSLI